MYEIDDKFREQVRSLISECKSSTIEPRTRGMSDVLGRVHGTLETLLGMVNDYDHYKQAVDAKAQSLSRVLEAMLDFIQKGDVEEAKLIGNEALER